jgi:hypothetical protein
MVRFLNTHLWVLMLAVAVAITVACSSSSGPSDDDAGGKGDETAADALTKS